MASGTAWTIGRSGIQKAKSGFHQSGQPSSAWIIFHPYKLFSWLTRVNSRWLYIVQALQWENWPAMTTMFTRIGELVWWFKHQAINILPTKIWTHSVFLCEANCANIWAKGFKELVIVCCWALSARMAVGNGRIQSERTFWNALWDLNRH